MTLDDIKHMNILLAPPAPGEDRVVPVDLGNGIESCHESELLRLQGGFENANEVAFWVQYHLPANGQLVHRSAHVHLKTANVIGEGVVATIG